MRRILLAFCLFFSAAALFQACVKKDFDSPPDLSGYDPNIPVNYTIRGLLDTFYKPNTAVLIDSEIVIKGIVTANDKSGNLYKEIVIDDSTAGLTVLLDLNGLYNDYPVGRKVYVRCKGLYLSNNNDLPILGFDPTTPGSETLNEIPGNQVADRIVKANVGNSVPVIEVNLSEVGGQEDPSLLNRLVKIKDAQFMDVAATWALPSASASRDLYTCDSSKIIVRTSNYANFANKKLPYGMGTFFGIYTTYRGTPQLLLRDTMDAQLNGPRCLALAGIPILSENFDGATSGIISIPGWANVAEVGGVQFSYGTVGSTTPYAKIQAYNTGQPSVISWLVSPGFDLTGAQNPRLTFKTNTGFTKGESFKTYISTNYVEGTNPATATWILLPASYAPTTPSGYSGFFSSGAIDLSAYTGVVHIAWKYDGGDPNKTGTWELDDVLVTKSN